MRGRFNLSDTITMVLEGAIGRNYARNIGEDEEFSSAVLEDIISSSDLEEGGYCNDDDVRLAVGRVLMYRLGIWY